MKEVLILIPAYNEEENIGAVLEALTRPPYRELMDVLVINDASLDRTAAAAAQYPVEVMTQVFNLGYGAALQTGYKYACEKGYAYVIQLDADGQHDVSNVMRIYEELRRPDEDGELPDIVIGSRFEEGSVSFPMSRLKMISIRFFRYLIRRTTGRRILDPTSGLQGLNARAAACYASFGGFDTMYPDANMIIQMLFQGFRIREISSVMHERKAGVSMHAGIVKPILYMMIVPLSILAIYLRRRRTAPKKSVISAGG